MIAELIFVAFCLLALAFALGTAMFRHPIHAALSLVGVVGTLSVLFYLLGAPFPAMVQLIVYAGGVLVLILFVIMLLNLKSVEEKISIPWHAAGIAVAGLFLLVAFLTIMSVSSLLPSASPLPAGYGTVGQVGRLLFSKYLYAFEVVSVLLLLAVIGAVALIRKPDAEDTDAD